MASLPAHRLRPDHGVRLAALGLWLALVWAGGPWGGLVRAEENSTPLERQIKAVCLLRFAQFVTWPESAFTSTNAPLVVSVLAPGSWHDPIRQSLEGRSINGHPIEVRFLDEDRPAEPGHVLFVTSPEHRRLAALIESRPRGTLLVGETEAFLGSGGMVTFVLVDGKVRFDVDKEAVDRAGLEIHPSMLAQARRIRNPGRGSRPR